MATLVAAHPAAASCVVSMTLDRYEPAWSRQGTLAFAHASDLWVVSPDGTSRRNLTDDPFTERVSPSWSPDGRRIVYSSNGDVWVIDTATGLETPLTTEGGLDPAWSPDGRRIAFVRRQADPGIYVMNADGTMQLRIVPTNRWVDADPSWSPDGSHVAFADYVDPLNVEIFAARSDGSELTRLTHDPALDLAPEWSPDGATILWVRGGASTYSGRVFAMASDGTGATPFSAEGEGASSPAWSPDGHEVAYGTTFRAALKIAATDGSSVRVLDQSGLPFRYLLRAPAVEIAPSRSVIEYGASVTLTMNVVVPGACGGPVTVGSTRLSSRRYDQGVFELLAAAPNRPGGWGYVDSPAVGTRYQARAGRELTAETVVDVQPKIMLVRVAGRRGLLETRVTSEHSYAGRSVLVERRTRTGSWVRLRRLKLGPRSSARFLAPRGRSRLQVYMPRSQAGAGYVGGSSRSLVVRR
jgi:Tol biopolymer transport system component